MRQAIPQAALASADVVARRRTVRAPARRPRPPPRRSGRPCWLPPSRSRDSSADGGLPGQGEPGGLEHGGPWDSPSMTASGSPVSTLWPGAIWSAVTVPPTGATIGSSIFNASMRQRRTPSPRRRGILPRARMKGALQRRGDAMHFELSDELTALVHVAREFAAEKIAPFVETWDAAHYFPYREVVKPMAELGFLGTVIPEEYGGESMGWLPTILLPHND